MSTDDKYGIGAGLLALGLAAGVILLGQLTFNKNAEDAMAKASTAAADSGKAPAAEKVNEPRAGEESPDGRIAESLLDGDRRQGPARQIGHVHYGDGGQYHRAGEWIGSLNSQIIRANGVCFSPKYPILFC